MMIMIRLVWEEYVLWNVVAVPLLQYYNTIEILSLKCIQVDISTSQGRVTLSVM